MPKDLQEILKECSFCGGKNFMVSYQKGVAVYAECMLCDDVSLLKTEE